MNLEELHKEIVSCGDSTPGETLHAVRDKVIAAKQRCTELMALLDAIAIEHVKASGPFEVGDIRYTVGNRKQVKCKNTGEAARTILETFGPDELANCLASDALKHGAASRLLPPDEFDRLFETTYTDKLELKALNTKFLPKGRA